MSLQQEIDERRAEIKTDEYAMSIGELASLYSNGEIDIHPEFQRYFRWTGIQKTRLIESILLGIPIPAIFVAQQPSGIWDVVDGLQRLSTIYEFMGILRGEGTELLPPLVLEGTRDLPSLNGKRWHNPDDEENSFTQAQQLIVKRSRLGVSIILYESDPRSKFELFQRINTGGTPLTDQEVRNSILIAANSDFYKWLRSLSKDPNFLTTISITERSFQEQYDMELALRFLILRSLPEDELTTTNIGDLSDFLTEKMLQIAEGSLAVDFKIEELAFKRTFEILARSLGDDSFRKYDHQRDKFTGSFLVTPFEVIALGIGFNFDLWHEEHLHLVHQLVRDVWANTQIVNNSGSGIRANTRIPRIVPIGRKLFRP